MPEIDSYEDLNEKSLEIILNFKPDEKFNKQSADELLKLKNDIKKAIALLGKEEQEVIELKYFQNLSIDKIAKMLNKPNEEVARVLQKSIEVIKGKIKSGALESKAKSNVVDFSQPKPVQQKLNSTERIDIKRAKESFSLLIILFSMTVFILIFAGSYYFLQKTVFNEMPLLSQIANDTNNFIGEQVKNNQIINKVIPVKKNDAAINSNNINISGSTSLLALSRRWENAFSIEYPQYHLSLVPSDSDRGIKSLIKGEIDIANSSRPVGYLDKKKAVELDEELVEQRVALDALIIIVNKVNPLDELSLEDLEGIFSGEIKNWQSLSGLTKSIVPLIREEGSGTNDFVLNRILESGRFSSSAVRKKSSQEIFQYIEDNEGAISFINSNNYPWDNEKIKYLKIKNYSNSVSVSPYNGKKLNEQAIRYGDYPLAHYLYVVTLSDAPKKAKDFVEWVLTPKGQEIVRYSGLISVFQNEN